MENMATEIHHWINLAIVLFLPAGIGKNAQIKFAADFAHLLAFPPGWLSSFLFTKAKSAL